MSDTEVRKAAVELLEEESPIAMDEAMERVADEVGVEKDRARVNLLIVSTQRRDDGNTVLTLDDSINPDDFLTEDVQENASEEPEEGPPDAVKEKLQNRVHPSVWKSESIKLDKDLEVEESPAPTEDMWYYLNKRADEGHPLVQDTEGYMEQEHVAGSGVKDTEHFSFLVADADFGVCVVGEPGCGKGEMVKYASCQSRSPMVRMNMGARITKEKLVGGWVPKENGGGMQKVLERAKDMADEEEVTVGKALEILGLKDRFEWRDGLFTLAFRHGWWILADELNAADPENLMPFFGALEDDDNRTLELSERSETIKAHPGFKFIATMNPPHHPGTNELNDALADRMYFMEKDYLEPEKEIRLLKGEENIDHSLAEDIVSLANSLRSSYPKEFSQTLTFRGCQRIARYTSLYGPQQSAREELLARMENEDEKDAIERKIESTLDEEM